MGICLPDETLQEAGAIPPGRRGSSQLSLFDEGEGDIAESLGDSPTGEVRRLVAARDDLKPLYVVGNGLAIGKSGEVLTIKERGKKVDEVRMGEVSQVAIFGNNQLTAAALNQLCRADIPVAHFSFGGWFYGLTQGLGLKNVFLRRAQFRAADDPEFCLHVARALVRSKIRNQRTLLKRNHETPPKEALAALNWRANEAGRATSLQSLLGIEGNAARTYFGSFQGMLKVGNETGTFDFRHRNRRPPRDPVNALLSLAYSLLSRDLTVAAASVGFDLFLGFFHQPRFGRPALALDLMEELRPLIADSAVLNAVNTRMVSASDFIRVGDAVALKPAGRKALIRAYENRIDTLVTHPTFGYRVSYRRIMEIQTRLLARVLQGEIGGYRGFETR